MQSKTQKMIPKTQKMTHFLLLSLITLCCIEPAMAEKKSTLRLCTGSANNQYHQLGQKLADLLAPYITVDVIITKGSWENLGRIDATPPQCDAMIAQDDAYALYQFENPHTGMNIVKIRPLLKEYLHVLCNTETIANDISKLDHHKTTFYTMPYGSGSYITWALIKKLNPLKYKHFKEVPTNANELFDHFKKSKSSCILIVNDLAKGVLEKANDLSNLSYKLINLDDMSLKTPVGAQKQALYQEDEIHENIYPKLQAGHIKTFTMNASFFVSADWQISNGKAYQLLVDTLNQWNLE